jgi:hypothetical protein
MRISIVRFAALNPIGQLSYLRRTAGELPTSVTAWAHVAPALQAPFGLTNARGPGLRDRPRLGLALNLQSPPRAGSHFPCAPRNGQGGRQLVDVVGRRGARDQCGDQRVEAVVLGDADGANAVRETISQSDRASPARRGSSPAGPSRSDQGRFVCRGPTRSGSMTRSADDFASPSGSCPKEQARSASLQRATGRTATSVPHRSQTSTETDGALIDRRRSCTTRRYTKPTVRQDRYTTTSSWRTRPTTTRSSATDPTRS